MQWGFSDRPSSQSLTKSHGCLKIRSSMEISEENEGRRRRERESEDEELEVKITMEAEGGRKEEREQQKAMKHKTGLK